MSQQDNLKQRITDFEKKYHQKSKNNTVDDLSQASKGMSFAISIIIEMFAPVLIGGFIGHRIDLWLEKKALFVFIFILLGLGVAFIQIKRLAMGNDDLPKLLGDNEAIPSDTEK